MSAGREVIAIIDAAYRLDVDDATWIDRIVHAAAPLLDTGHGVAGYLLDTRRRRPAHTPVLVGRDPWNGAWREAWWDARVARMPARFVAELAGFGSPTFASQSCGAVVRGGVVARLARHLPPLPLPPGVTEALVISGYNVDGDGVVLFAFRSARIDTPPRGRESMAWQRISGHLAAASRLRRKRSDPQVVSPALARSMDHARTGGADPLAAWPPLSMQGATVVPTPHGYAAYANTPVGPAIGSLTPRERAAVALLDLGRSNKAIAYELGVAPSTVSSLLSTAAKRLGVTNTRGLIARTRGIVHAVPAADLTESEAVVMALLVAGLPDLEIAEARGTARTTITKQVDRVFKKLGVTSRRELVSLVSSYAPWTAARASGNKQA
jgi:DNA-binding NarL/FixJ family response regulator